MTYLCWSRSPWYAYSHVDGRDGDDALLVARHELGAGATVAARELLRAGCEGRPEWLRDFTAGRLGDYAGGEEAAMKDIDVLVPAVDRSLFEVRNAGKNPLDGQGISMLLTWSVELMSCAAGSCTAVSGARVLPPRRRCEDAAVRHER